MRNSQRNLEAPSVHNKKKRVLNHVRHREILTRLQHDELLSTRELAIQYGISQMTARRDIDSLAAAGLAVKIRGGARLLHPSGSSRSWQSDDWESSPALFRTAAALAEPGMTVGIAAGYSAARMAMELCQIPDLTIVTNSFAVSETLLELSDRFGIENRIVILPGLLDANRSTVGPPCVEALRGLRLDVTFVSASGFDYSTHAFSDALSAGEVIRAFASSTRVTVALAERSRWTRLSTGNVPASIFAAVIADFSPNQLDQVAFAQAGSSLILAA